MSERKIDFRKYHGLGNDYLVLDPADFPRAPGPEGIRAICDRNRGVGSDGILYGPSRWSGGMSLRIFNPDGSEAEKSGNGARIFAWFLRERGYVDSDEYAFMTPGGRVVARVEDAAARLIRMDMGSASFDAAAVGAEAGLPEVVDRRSEFGGRQCRITCVSMGNPHCVVTGQPADEATARALGPIIERSPLFPRRINVQFLEVESRSEIRIAIWERGAGYTLASGSSSCASAAAARRLGLVGDEVRVRMPGGELLVRFAEGTTYMTGPVAEVFEGFFSEALLAASGLVRAGPGGAA
jgi:diaminopimelate epimerase